MAILWFQFLAVQLVMLVAMSTTITGEDRAGTLSILLATPLNHFQIVLGKLLVRLLHVAVLLLCSLPLLMLIRVFGGVPADALAACLIASFLTAMLIGALTLLWSVRHHGWVSVALTVVSLGAYHVVLAIVAVSASQGHEPANGRILACLSPWAAFILAGRFILDPIHNPLGFQSASWRILPLSTSRSCPACRFWCSAWPPPGSAPRVSSTPRSSKACRSTPWG